MSDGMSDSWQSKLERLMGMLGDVDVDPAINDELTHVYRREEYDATEIRMLREQLEIANLMLESRNRVIAGISHLETELCNALARAERAEAALAAVPWQALLNISHALEASDAARDPDEAALLAFLNQYAPWVPNESEG